MISFREWLKRLAELDNPIDVPTIDNANRPDLNKAGLDDDSDLPMGMRSSNPTSAFKSYKLPKKSKRGCQ